MSKLEQVNTPTTAAYSLPYKTTGIDYRKLYTLLGCIIEEAHQARKECLSEVPNDTIICNHTIENLGNIFDEISNSILSDDMRSIKNG